jgi:hypothetical protein
MWLGVQLDFPLCIFLIGIGIFLDKSFSIQLCFKQSSNTHWPMLAKDLLIQSGWLFTSRTHWVTVLTGRCLGSSLVRWDESNFHFSSSMDLESIFLFWPLLLDCWKGSPPVDLKCYWNKMFLFIPHYVLSLYIETFQRYLSFILCIHVWVWVHVWAQTVRHIRRQQTKASESVELELQMVVSPLMWVLGTELGSPVKATGLTPEPAPRTRIPTPTPEISWQPHKLLRTRTLPAYCTSRPEGWVDSGLKLLWQSKLTLMPVTLSAILAQATPNLILLSFFLMPSSWDPNMALEMIKTIYGRVTK